MIIERIIITGILALLGAGGYVFLKQWHVGRLNKRTAVHKAAAITTPTLLYFRSDNCAACPTQGHYVQEVADWWNGRVAVRKIDTDSEPETAQQYGIMSLPTTMLVDKSGSVRDVNYGLTNAQKLSKQIERVMVSS